MVESTWRPYSGHVLTYFLFAQSSVVFSGILQRLTSSSPELETKSQVRVVSWAGILLGEKDRVFSEKRT